MYVKNYFENWDGYFKLSRTLFVDQYKHMSKAVSPYLSGSVVDVGSGGIINYSLKRVTHLDCVDLYAIPEHERLKNRNITYLQGDAVLLPLPSRKSDCVIMQLLIHHLAQKNLHETNRVVLKAFKEAFRILKPEGKLLIIESCLPRWLEILWDFFYQPMSLLIRLIFRFPRVKQFSRMSLLGLLEKTDFTIVKIEQVPLGRYVSQFGIIVPSFLTPIRTYFIMAVKH